MVQKHTVPGENMIDDEAHHPVIRRSDGGAKQSPDVFTVMRIPRLAIHDSHAAEDPGSFAAHRLHEVRLPEFALGIRPERFFHLLLLGFPARQAFFIEIDLVFGQGEMFDVKFPFDDCYAVAECATLLTYLQFDKQFMSPRLVL